jgi:hypothetical protein
MAFLDPREGLTVGKDRRSEDLKGKRAEEWTKGRQHGMRGHAAEALRSVPSDLLSFCSFALP